MSTTRTRTRGARGFLVLLWASERDGWNSTPFFAADARARGASYGVVEFVVPRGAVVVVWNGWFTRGAS